MTSAADAWKSAFTGFGPSTIGVDYGDKSYSVVLEDDDSLRERLLYVSGDSEARVRVISVAKGAQLDALAAELGLKRRETEGL